MKAFFLILFVIALFVLGFLFALSGRYEIEPLGRSRDVCLRLDNWTGKVILCPIDSSLVIDSSTKPIRPAQTAEKKGD